MKGSPIRATALACIIMLSMYLAMRVAFSKGSEPSSTIEIVAPLNTDQTTVHAEIYFSKTAKSFTLTHPASGKTLIKQTQLNDAEWSGQITLPLKNLTSEDIEILCSTQWASSSAENGYQFMQVTISPDELDPQSQTIRAQGNITDVITFHWKDHY